MNGENALEGSPEAENKTAGPRNLDLQAESELIELVNFQGEKTSGRYDSPIFQDVKCC